jgi:hypothetical protein
MNTKLKIGIIILSIIIFVLGGGYILTNIQEKFKIRGYQKSIYYCEKDEDCILWWGPAHCGCGNKYYKFPKKTKLMRPSLVCSGDPNYQCKCIDNKCQ